MARFGVGCSGHLVEKIQTALADAGVTQPPSRIAKAFALVSRKPARARSVNVDGDYGKKTAATVVEFQRAKLPTLPPTGAVDETTWDALFDSKEPFPAPFERCLQLTASFEGTDWGGCVGNFDGAIVTYGIVGFTAQHGELAKVLQSAFLEAPELTKLAPVSDKNLKTLLTSGDPRVWIVCVDSAGKVRKEWRAAFAAWGKSPAVRKAQKARALDIYWDLAERDRSDLGLPAQINVQGLLFDTAVQNGGVKDASKARFSRWKAAASRTLREAILFIAEEAASTARARFYADVKARKSTFGIGSGKTHGKNYSISAWGFD